MSTDTHIHDEVYGENGELCCECGSTLHCCCDCPVFMDWTYEHTHYSKRDGSPAMLWSEEPFILINEEGFTWADDRNDWGTYEEVDWEQIAQNDEQV